MKKALFKDSFQEIKNTYKRFLSILLMAFLGVGFFAGLKACSPDMVDTIDKYYSEQNVFDIEVISTLGLTDEDVSKLYEIDDIDKISATFEVDGEIDIDNKQIVTKVMCVDEINVPILLSGNLPENENECLVEEEFLNLYNKKIGDVINVEIENTTSDEGEDIAFLKSTGLKIVGTVKSPLYISRDRGNSSLGAGKINYYIYISKNNINAKDVYTNLYITLKNAKQYTTSSKKYEDYVEDVKNKIENIKEERQNSRYDILINNVNKKIVEAEEELQREKQNAENKIKEAEDDIQNGKVAIKKAEEEINKNKQNADKQFSEAENRIEKANKEIQEKEQELLNKEQEANKQFEQLEQQKNQMQQLLTQTNTGIQELQKNYNEVIKKLEIPELTQEQKVELEQTKIQLEEKIKEAQNSKNQLENQINEISNGIQTGKQEIANAKEQIQSAKAEISKQTTTLQQTKKSSYQKIQNALTELELSKKELSAGEEELEKNKKEFEQKIIEAEQKIVDAKEKVNEIEHPKWYILDRYSNIGYNSFIQDTQSIANIAQVFPIVFFVVATLISLTSMTRMVEEQRMQIGTLKALGYNKIQIASKYIIYASLACIIGGILGMCIGFILLPKIVWLMYQMMYQITEIQISFNWLYATIGLLLISICIIGATIFVIIKDLKETPSMLMRPKAPKMGKRVFLEKIHFIWKHLNFTQKVTVRNIFRYKKRALMTIIGILGCTALILVGFGIKDAVSNILPNQFEKVFQYDMQINLKSNLSEEQKEKYIDKLETKDEIEKVAQSYMTSVTAINGENEEEIQIIVPKNQEEINKIINLKDIKSKEKIELKDNEIFITDKVAQLLGVEQGDYITIKDSDGNENKVKISNVVENYISHYIYMSKTMYEQLYVKEYSTNVLLTKNIELTEEQEDDLISEIINQKEVASVTRMSSTINAMNNMMKSLNYVVIILIVSAGLLAFVVLYNLSNVNISERIRELATIKVLGFYDKEVYSYVTRETVILTIIGIILGLICGYFLNGFILETCEINILRFAKDIKPISYVYAALITIVFTIIVNIVTFFALKKIDMIESLKSIE